jgi:parallel beta-helix repeat protein
MRRLLYVALLALAACGSSSDPPPEEPPPNPLYVDPTGSDNNFGDFESPLRSIRKAAQLARDDYDIIVAPGSYAEEVSTDRTGIPAQRVSFIADTNGVRTQSNPGAVIIEAQGAGFSLGNSRGSLIEGFTVTGATAAAIEIKDGSHEVTVRDCILVDNPGHGVRVQDSAAVTVFNNLIANNGRSGILLAGQIAGSPEARVVNNTIARNGLGRISERGITVGTPQAASPRSFQRNNIVFENGPEEGAQLRVLVDPRSDLGFDGDYQILSPPTYEPDGARGPHDRGVSPDFVDAEVGDYHLSPESPALDTGDPGLASEFRNHLRTRSATGEEVDADGRDLGFHFSVPNPG